MHKAEQTYWGQIVKGLKGRVQPEQSYQMALLQWPRLRDSDSNKYLVPRATSADSFSAFFTITPTLVPESPKQYKK